MIPISSPNSGELVWTKTRHNCRHELKLKSELVGSLERTSWAGHFLAVSPYGTHQFALQLEFISAVVNSS